MTNPTQRRSLSQRGKNALIGAYQSTKHFVVAKWQEYEPKIAKLTNITTAVTSATSTFQVTFGFLPIITSVLTIIAAAPLFNFLVPELLYSPYFYNPAIIMLSVFAGYMKYQELLDRAKLDRKIVKNEQMNEALNKTVDRLEKTLAQTKQSLVDMTKKCDHKAKALCPLKHIHTTGNKQFKKAPLQPTPRRSERLRAIG